MTEGEIDALSFAEAGRTDVISAPTGANRNLAWMDRFVKTHLEDKRVVYVAVDADRKGEELGRELIRRLGAGRCRIAAYPEGCKDANDVLVKPGGEALLRTLKEAAEIPLEGVFTIGSVSAELRLLFEKGMERGADTGWENFDRYCTFETG
ncbi:MAG: toprim domain-containing protein, partial [Mediterranea sp.]|nr:toprim domain-containing protein [Mediterranea sp.]